MASSIFSCVVDNIPGLNYFTASEKKGGALAEDVVDLQTQGVILHDIVGYSMYPKMDRPEQRYFFLLPGKLVSSSVSFDFSDIALKDAILDCWRGPTGGYGLDLSPNLTVKKVSERALLVYNAVSAIPSSTAAPSLSLPQLDPAEVNSSVILTFPSAVVADAWSKAILEEKERLYLEELVQLDANFATALHAGLWRGVTEKQGKWELVRAAYYRGLQTNSPAPIFIHVYRILAAFLSKDQMASSEVVDAYLEVMEVLAVDVTTRLFFLSWSITPHFLTKFEIFYQQLLLDEEAAASAAASAAEEPKSEANPSNDPAPARAAAAASSSESSIASFFRGLMKSFTGAASLDPLVVVALAKYLRAKTSAAGYAQNREVIAKIYGYKVKAGSGLASQACLDWFSLVTSGKGKAVFPVKITWRQAQLVAEPGLYAGYFYVDFCIESNDVRRARALCSLLPYEMTEHFAALHVNLSVMNDDNEELDHAAHFVSYLEWDSLHRGYEEFELKNRGNRRVVKLISEARETYNVPICTASHLDLLKIDAGAIKEDFINQLLADVNAESNPHLRALRMVLGNWMRSSKASTGTVEVPRKAQLITTLLLSSWLQFRNSIVEGTPSSPLAKTPGPARHNATAAFAKSLIGQVTEGEDKGLLLALVAAYMSQVHGKIVHILFSTADDLFRDFTRTAPFFKAMSMTSSMNDFSVSGASVVFCLQRDLCHFYRDSSFRGVSPLSRTLLLINDVKDLQVSTNPNSIYGKRDDVLSTFFKDALQLVLSQGEAAELPEVKEELPADRAAREVSLAKAKQSVAEFRKMQENKPLGYSKQSDGSIIFINADGRLNPSKYSLGLECARFMLSSEVYVPSVTSKFFFQSLPHLLDQYEGVIGFEAMGGPVSEGSTFLAFHMGAWTFHIPNDEFQNSVNKILTNEEFFSSEDPSSDIGGEGDNDAEKAVDGKSANSSPKKQPLRQQPPPEAFSPAGKGLDDDESGPMSQLSMGAMMAELTDRFYKRYPFKIGSSWPSRPEHRLLVNFLENEALHDADGVQDFAGKLKLAQRGSYGIGV